MTAAVYAIATLDTKGTELAFVASRLRDVGITVKIVDVGTLGPAQISPDISRDFVLRSDSSTESCLLGKDRGQAVGHMARALRQFMISETADGRVSGVIGIGGSGGTALITTALRALPIGLPKLMVSTVASGNVAPYVGCSDITMMYSVVDVAGLNAVSKVVLGNAANAMAGMVQRRRDEHSTRPTIGMTMFGVTTPCVDNVRKRLESEGYDCLVFHATGAGGQAMEQLVASGLITAVLDITTTEVADEVVGGVFPAGPDRFDKLLQSRIPFVLSLGALDMVNFGAKETVPPQFQQRLLHSHNSQVTLMRTTPEENRQFARWIANKLNRATAKWTLVIPEQGLSLLDLPGQPFHDPTADAALFDELTRCLQTNQDRRIVRAPYHINAPEFCDTLLRCFHDQTSPAS